MKRIVTFIIVIFISSCSPSESNIVSSNRLNQNNLTLLEDELRNSVLDFIRDFGLNPDSCYIPFNRK